VERAERQWQEALFVITGDHNSRKFLNARPRLYERRAVPCIFYGPSVLGNVMLPKNAAGDHLDIAPTLIELIAPEGFTYATMGKDLFDPLAPNVGYGTEFIITPTFIADDKDGMPQSVFVGEKAVGAMPEAEQLEHYRKRYNALRALSWWQVFGGN
jgi:phosphoglycerol transferase MdoB-like AlkP superfamily enzyme